MRIVTDDLRHPAVLALIEHHIATAHENSPPGSVFALNALGLRDRAVTLWTAWAGEDLLGMGALKQLDPLHGELKSMRTAPAYLRQGVAAAMLDHLIGEARRRGYTRLSLETGNTDAFAPARTLYKRAGFVPSPRFADYVDESFSTYYTRTL